MKNIFTLFISFAICILSFAQAPQQFNYQGVARGQAGNPFSNQSLGFKLSILQGTPTGTAVYVETQAVTSDSKGIFSLIVGSGTLVSGSISSINWGGNSFYLKTEIDTTGGSNYQFMGTTQMLSVPYALNSNNGNPAGTIITYAGASIPAGFLLCDGSAVSRTTYSALFTALGIAWGQGDGSTTFNLPDLRGRFLRGVDGAAGNDPDKASRTATNTGGNTGNNVGSLQADDFKSHIHGGILMAGVSASNLGSTLPNTVSGGQTSATGGNETRPKNVDVNFIIKY